MAAADNPTEPTRTQLVTTGRADTAAAALLTFAITLFTLGAATDGPPRDDQVMFAAAIALCVLAGTMTLVAVHLRLDDRRQRRAAQRSTEYEVRHQAVIDALADARTWHEKLLLAIRTNNRLIGAHKDLMLERLDEVSAKVDTGHRELSAKLEELAGAALDQAKWQGIADALRENIANPGGDGASVFPIGRSRNGHGPA